MRDAGLDRLVQRELIHIRDHQDLARRRLDRDAHDESVRVETGGEFRPLLQSRLVHQRAPRSSV